jgi:hypothetical protein
MISEAKEVVLREQLILMWGRNFDKPYIMKRVFKRFIKCINAFIK